MKLSDPNSAVNSLFDIAFADSVVTRVTTEDTLSGFQKFQDQGQETADRFLKVTEDIHVLILDCIGQTHDNDSVSDVVCWTDP